MPVRSNLNLSEISIPSDRREPTKGRIASVAKSLSEIGQLHPIGVNEDYRLIYGRTRYEAAKCLGWKKIEATIHDVDDLHAELMEIDENQERDALPALAQVQAALRRKEIYLALHPETGHGKSPGYPSPEGGKVASAATLPSFAKDSAEKTGQSERTVRRDVAIAEALNDDAAEAIKDTPVADNKSQLEQLSKLPDKEQVKAAKKIKAGKAKTVKEATKPKAKAATPSDAAKAQVKIWADTISRWLGKSPSIDEYRGTFPGKHGDAVVKLATDLYEALKVWEKAIK